MKINEARELITGDFIKPGKQKWSDLGCGSGTFTLALAGLLSPESIIYAVDRDRRALESLPDNYQGVNIQKHRADFIEDDYPFAGLDGILMANSLHYVKNKRDFIRRAEEYAKPDFSFLIVEYDNNTPNPWVPYPLSFQSLRSFFIENGYLSVRKLRERESIYNSGNIYAAIVSR